MEVMKLCVQPQEYNYQALCGSTETIPPPPVPNLPPIGPPVSKSLNTKAWSDSLKEKSGKSKRWTPQLKNKLKKALLWKRRNKVSELGKIY